MTDTNAPQTSAISDQLVKTGIPETKVTVRISNELVHLLSDQLYQSPLKAIEELVVNSYDADAKTCRVFVPSNDELSRADGRKYITVFDTGTGLSKFGMLDLWHIGRSNKRTEQITKLVKRKQIGKFGIGKLATYTIANKLTYASKTSSGVISATLDFKSFSSDAVADAPPVEIDVLKIAKWEKFRQEPVLSGMLKSTHITEQELKASSWTLVILEELKPKAEHIKLGSLTWVLRTAMPLRADFALYLNGEKIESSKANYEVAVDFNLSELPAERIKALNTSTGDGWKKTSTGLISTSFKQGVSGRVIVTERTLPGKSDDLLRSYGFFIKVRGRLINEDDAFFGMTPLHHGTLNRFRADIEADDLDEIITAPREGVSTSGLRDKFEPLLVEVFQEARQRYDAFLEEREKKESQQKEHIRSFVGSALVEEPIASALAQTPFHPGAEADDTWFYFDLPPEKEIPDLINRLYTQRKLFAFKYLGLGKQSRLVKLDLAQSFFAINSDHPFVAAHRDDPRSQLLLEDLVMAEVLLEAQLRLAKIAPQAIGEVLEERDKLLRALSFDHPYSPVAIAKALRDAANDEHDLELALVAAARSLGFVAKHISGSSEPDGIARFVSYPKRTTVLTLEAKSSKEVPSLSAIDFGGLDEHRREKDAQGCLLLAPEYPGSTSEDSAAATRAKNLGISCWKIKQLARVVEEAHARHINAKQIIDIVLTKFAPSDVAAAVDALFTSPSWDKQQLAKAVIDALRLLADKLTDTPRTLNSVATVVAQRSGFEGITEEDVRKAVSYLAAASQGALIFDGEILTVLASYDELARRASSLTGASATPLRLSKLRDDLKGDGSTEGH